MKKIIGCYLLLLLGCSSNKSITQPPSSMPTADLPAFDYEGHRGCRGLMPENSLPAMTHALDLGVTTLEMDIVFTKDSIAILSHEPIFNHEITTLPSGVFIDEKEENQYNIFQLTFAETKRYDVGLKPHPRFPKQQKLAAHKPSLDEVFYTVNQYLLKSKRPHPFFNIETKTKPSTDDRFHPAPGPFVDLLMKVIQQQQMEPWVIIQSFDPRTLIYLHAHYPQIKTALLIEDYDKRSLQTQINQLGFVPTIYSPHEMLVTPTLIQQCHKQHIKVVPWTINEVDRMQLLKDMGVDGLISDYPDLYRSLK